MLIAVLQWLEPDALIERGGLALVAAIVFAESGLILGFFLPGDSLLFVAGFLTSGAGGHVLPSIWLVVPVLVVAAVAGDQVGYLVGRRAGRSLASRPPSRMFDPRHVERASVFFDRHGPKTIVLARFVPIVRTFAPIVAGVGKMPYRTFVTFNVIGALLWAAGLTLLGHALGGIDVVREHIELAVIAVVAISLLPAALEFARHRRHRRSALGVDVEPLDVEEPTVA